MSGTISGVSDASFNTQSNNKNKILAQIAANIERLPTFGSVLSVENDGTLLGIAQTLNAGAGTNIQLSGSIATISAAGAGGTYSAGTGISLAGTFPHQTIENAGVLSLNYGGDSVFGPIEIGENLSLSGATLNASAAAISVYGENTRLVPLGFTDVSSISFVGNAYLSPDGYSVAQLGAVTEQTTQVVSAEVDSAFIVFEYNAYSAAPPVPVTLLNNIGDCRSYFGTFSSASVITLSTSGDGDTIAAIVTGAQEFKGNFAGTLTSGTVASTISLPTLPGRLYVAIADKNNNCPISSQSNLTIDTSLISTISTATEPDPTAVLLGMDVQGAENVQITITPGAPGFSSDASYLAVLVSPLANSNPHEVTVTVPPILVIDNNQIVSGDMTLITAGAGFSAAGTGDGAVTFESYLEIGTISAQSLAVGGDLSFSGTSTVATISHAPLLAQVGTSTQAVATLYAGAGAVFTGTAPQLTIATSGSGAGTLGVEYAGTIYPTLAAGAGITLSGAGLVLTASANGGGAAQNFTICTFQNTGRGTPPNQLYIFDSPDGVTFSAPAGVTNPAFTFPSTGGAGTSSGTWACDILYWQGKYWLAYEFDNLSNSNNKFGIANATTLAGPWTWVADVVAVSTTTNATNVWNPRWFLDTDGSVHIIVNVQSGHTFDTAMQPIILDATNAALTAWSAPTSIAGTFPANMIDTFMVGPQQSPNGKYNLWFKDEDTLYIGYMTSSSLKTGYTVTESGNWAGFGQAEGPMLTYLGGSHWRVYLVSPVAGPLTYSDSFDNWATWTAPAAISTGSISPGTGGIIAHQTGAGSSFLPGAVDIDGVGAAGKYLRGNGVDFIPSNILLVDLPSGVGSAPVEQNGTVVASAPTAINFTGSGARVSNVSGAATIMLPIWAPLVNGDIPGPTAISDGFGQFIMVAT